MNNLTFIFLALVFSASIACNQTQKTEQKETIDVEELEAKKPTRHIIVADITSRDRAIAVMDSTTAEMKSRETLDVSELSDIHFITYSLEKAIAYFAQNSTGDQQKAAEELAVIVEEVHLYSENNRPEEAKAALEKYYQLAETFRKDL